MIAALKAKIQSKITNDKHFAELIKGSGVAFILRIVGIAAGYLFTLLVTRSLGAEAWGNFALSLVVLQMASVIGRLGMDTALLRFTAEYMSSGKIANLKAIYGKILSLIIPFSILISVFLYALSLFLAVKVFHKKDLVDYFRIASFVVVPFVILYIHSEGIRGLKKIKEYMFLQQTGVFVLAVIVFLVVLEFLKSQFLPAFSYAISIIILAIISVYLWHKYFSCFSDVEGSDFSITYKDLFSVSFPMLISGSLSLIMGWTDTLMLGIFRNSQEVGIYNVAFRLSMITSIVLLAVNTIAAPKFAGFWGKGDVERLARFAQESTKLIFWTSLPVLILFLVFPDFVLIMFGSKFKEGATALSILAIGQFVNAMCGSVGNILLMTGYQKFHQNVVLFGAIINLILNYLLIPKYGIVGAAFASTIVVIYWNVLFSIKVYKILHTWVFYPRFGGIK